MNVIHPEATKADPRPAASEPAAAPAALETSAPSRPLWPWLIGVAILGAAGWYVLEGREAALPPAAATPALPPGEFRLNEAEMRALRIEPVALRAFRPERVAEGRIAANDDRSTPMLAPYTGRVTRAFARVGDEVAQGAPLYEIETPDVTGAANDLLSALDNVQKMRVALDQARREQARQQSLLAARAASQRDLEQATAALLAAQADKSSADAQLESARDKLRVLGRSPEQVAEIERTRQVSGVIAVTAPLSGTITQRRVGPGQWLTAGQGEPVFTIADLSTAWMVAAVRELDAPLIRPGLQVEVTVGALPGRVFAARIVRVNAGLDPATRRLTAIAEIPDPNRELRPEMFATFRIAVGEAQQRPAVPAGAVIFRGADAFAWVSTGEGRFAQRQLRLGIRDGDQLEVLEGLAQGDRVVTGGALFIDRAARID